MESLLAAGHEVHYLATEPFPISHANCHFHRFPWPAAITDNLVFWGIFHLLAPIGLLWLGIRYRITHAFAFSTTYSLFLQPVRLMNRIPLTLFLRADALENHRLKKTPSWIIAIETLIEGLSIAGVRVYGVTRTLTDRIVNRHTRFKPAHHGILLNDISPSTSDMTATRKMPGVLRLGCVGILEERKNIPLILRCISHFKDAPLHLYIFGTGPAERSLKDMTQSMGISEGVTFMGWVDTPELIWGQIDVLLFPSLHEGLSNAVLEAIASATPVLASDIPEHREILPDDNLVAGNTLESWNRSLAEILANPAGGIKRLVESQSEYTQKLRFDWDTRIRELILARSTDQDTEKCL